MAFQQIGGKNYYKKWGLWNEGDTFTGRYVEEGRDKTYGKPFYVFKVTEFDFGENSNYDPEHPDKAGEELEVGQRFVLNHAAQIENGLEDVEYGTLVRVTLNEIGVLPDTHKYKGKKTYGFIVEADHEDFIPQTKSKGLRDSLPAADVKNEDEFGEDIL